MSFMRFEKNAPNMKIRSFPVIVELSDGHQNDPEFFGSSICIVHFESKMISRPG